MKFPHRRFIPSRKGTSDAADLKIKRYTLWVTAGGFLLTVATLWFNFYQLRKQQEKDFQLEFWKSRLELYKDACQTASTLATSEKGSDEYKKAFDHFRQLFWGALCIVESRQVETAMINFNYGLTNPKGQNDPGQNDLEQKPKEQYGKEQNDREHHRIEDLSYDLAHTCRDSLRKAFNLTDADLGFIADKRERGATGAPTPTTGEPGQKR
jgi:hypothetical protein